MSAELRRAAVGQCNNQSAVTQHDARFSTGPVPHTFGVSHPRADQQPHQMQQPHHSAVQRQDPEIKTCASDDELTAIERIRMSCPHRLCEFSLIDGLLLDEQSAQQQQQHQQQQHEDQEQQTALSPDNEHTRYSSASGSTGEASPITKPTADQPGITEFGLREEPAPAQVCHTFQIVNQTIEQLERLICDPCDRRIRKISSMSQCDIEIRSELPSRKFSAAKNFCILRAISPGRVGKCRGLLRQQMGWVLLPKL